MNMTRWHSAFTRLPSLLRFTLATLVLAAAGLGAPSAQADDPDNCLWCHQYRGLGRYVADEDAFHLYFVSPAHQLDRLGPHARLVCTDCHDRADVGIIPHRPVAPVDCTKTCHLRDEGGLARRYTHADVAWALGGSVHKPDTLAKLNFTAGPLLRPGQAQCLYCHDEPVYRDISDIIPTISFVDKHTTSRCNGCHAQQVPIDTRFYLRHVASRLLRARPPLEMTQVCAVCHSDPLVRDEFDLQDATIHYTGTFHGKAALLGEQRTADCVDCHARADDDVHRMLAHDDERSITFPANRAASCRSVNCHPGADPSISQASVHLDQPSLGSWEVALTIAFIFFTLATFGPSLTLTILELFQVVIGRHVEDEAPMHALTEEVLRHPDGRRRLQRFTVGQRWQHWLLAALFATLVITGFPMKFASHLWARHVIESLGGLSQARFIHHWAGVALIVGFLLHVLYALWGMLQNARAPGPDGRRLGLVPAVLALPMWVGPADMIKTMQLLGYLVGFRKRPPRFGRFSPDQKFEYFGVFWGTMLLGVTGLLLWNLQVSSRFVSGRIFNLALIAHTFEAFLAVIHVGILHICNVTLAPQVFPFSPATLTGNTPVERLSEVHGEQVIAVAKELGVAVPPEVEHA